MINVWIDSLTPCLTNNTTGDIIETEVLRVRRKSYLSKFNKTSGWYTSWAKLADKHEVYALVIKGTTDIQGMVALQQNDDFKAVYVAWMVAAPHNNKKISGEARYSGVGGHLFAIAADKSMEYGYGGAITGNAANMRLVEHYCEVFHAQHIKMLHPYQIAIFEKEAEAIREIYDYEWTDDDL